MERWYFVSKCPLHDADGCSKEAWRRASVYGQSEKEARSKLLAHLRNSSKHHGRDDAELIQIVADVDVGEYGEAPTPKDTCVNK